MKFLLRVKATGLTARHTGSRRLTKLTAKLKRVIEMAMSNDNKTTAIQLHALLASKGHNLSLRTILVCRKLLDWTFRGSAYCQMIGETNKV